MCDFHICLHQAALTSYRWPESPTWVPAVLSPGRPKSLQSSSHSSTSCADSTGDQAELGRCAIRLRWSLVSIVRLRRPSLPHPRSVWGAESPTADSAAAPVLPATARLAQFSWYEHTVRIFRRVSAASRDPGRQSQASPVRYECYSESIGYTVPGESTVIYPTTAIGIRQLPWVRKLPESRLVTVRSAIRRHSKRLLSLATVRAGPGMSEGMVLLFLFFPSVDWRITLHSDLSCRYGFSFVPLHYTTRQCARYVRFLRFA